MTTIRRLAVLCTLAAATWIAEGRIDAMSYIPPRTLAELAQESDVVVLARAEAEFMEMRTGVVYTYTDFVVTTDIAGTAPRGSILRVRTPGGVSEDTETIVPGAPRFELDETYYICLQARPEGDWLPTMMSYGVFRRVDGTDGVSLLVPIESSGGMHEMARPDGEPHDPLVSVRTTEFVERMSAVLDGQSVWRIDDVRATDEDLSSVRTEVLIPAEGDGEGDGGGGGAPAGCFYFTSGSSNWRWNLFDSHGTATIRANYPGDPSAPGNGFRLIQEGLDLWMGISRTSYNMLFVGARDASLSCGGTGGFMMLDDPCSDIADLSGCGGVLAFGGGNAGGSHSFDGKSWTTMSSWFAVMNNGVGCLGTTGYQRLVAHELGHGIGFNHASDGGALMNGGCCNAINSTDTTCARFTYPASDPNNRRPTADAGSSRTISLGGDTIRLTGSVSDDSRPIGGTVTTRWTQLVGPGTAIFGDESELDTTVKFTESGDYLLGLVADDGELVSMDQVAIDVTIFVGSRSLFAFAQGSGGYSGTTDTKILELSPSANQSTTTVIGVDTDDPGVTQVLIRFDDIFGEGDDQITPTTSIISAHLELSTTDPGDGAALHRMLREWNPADGWNSYGDDGVELGVDALDRADDEVSGTSGVVSADVTPSIRDGSLDPCSNYGWVLIPLGGNGWDFDSAEGSEPPRLVIETSSARRNPLVSIGQTWDYFKGTRAPPADWRSVDFEPNASWLSGPTGIGYDDDDDATVLSDMEGRYPSIFCRRKFTFGGTASELRLEIDYDDGYVAYLNGTEVARSDSMVSAGSPVPWNALASGREAGPVDVEFLDPAALRSGVNVLAIEVHNTTIDSSDLSFIPQLIASSVIVDAGEDWKFQRGTVTPPADWVTLDFDDSTWEEGPTSIGYGDGDDATELLDMEDNYITVFCRKTFSVENPASLGEMVLSVVVDDGCVAHLNGEELGRFRVDDGPVNRLTPASEGGEAEAAIFEFPSSRLVPGDNVLAISVHNSDISSSDLSVTPVLGVTPPEPPSSGCVSSFYRGDVSGEGDLDISDSVRVLNYLFREEDSVDCHDAADADDDGAVTVTDAVRLLEYLFREGTPPPAPGRECGEDPTTDALGRCTTASCVP